MGVTQPSADVKRWTGSVVWVAVLLALASPAGAGQIDPESGYDGHLEVILETTLIETPDGFTTDIGFDLFSMTDDIGDGEFSTGETPQRQLTAEMDIARFALLTFGEHPFPELTGDELCAAPEFGDSVRRFCSNPISDPAAFANGAHISTFQFAAPPGLFNSTELCEWVVWIDDPSSPDTFEVLDAFPNDPAGGTNAAVGLRSNFGDVSTFRLELTDGGFFQDVPTDTVAIFEGNHLSLLTPPGEFMQPAAVNGYTFCTGGQFSAADSVADTTGLFTPVPAVLMPAPPPASTTTTTSSTTTSSTTTTSTTTTTTEASTTTTAEAAETTRAESEGGEFPWAGLVFGGLLLMTIGIWLAARKKGCEDELRAWQAAQKACDEATEALKKARERAEKAEKARDQAEDDIEELCDAMPPVCWEGDPEDTYVEDPNVPGSRIDRLDLYVTRAWSKAVWKQYRDGEKTAQQVEDAWGEDPPPDFDEKVRKEYEKAKAKKTELDKALEKTEKELEEAEAAVEPAEAKAKNACDKAAKAKAAYDACMKKPSPAAAPGATGTGTGTDPGSTPGSTPGGQPSEPQPCSPEGGEREGESTTLRVNVPIRLEPRIAGGHAHAAREQADEIGAALQQAEVGAKAIGRIFSFAGAGRVVTNRFGAASDAATGTASEVLEFPIPTNLPTAVANVTELLAKIGRVTITKVADLQERRLPDVDLTITIKKATYVLTCTKMEVCRNGEWVSNGTKLTIEAGAPRSFGSKRYAALTWAEAQEELAEYARRRFRPDLQRSLRKMADFQKKCAEGG